MHARAEVSQSAQKHASAREINARTLTKHDASGIAKADARANPGQETVKLDVFASLTLASGQMHAVWTLQPFACVDVLFPN